MHPAQLDPESQQAQVERTEDQLEDLALLIRLQLTRFQREPELERARPRVDDRPVQLCGGPQ
jgi:hypothetical protein